MRFRRMIVVWYLEYPSGETEQVTNLSLRCTTLGEQYHLCVDAAPGFDELSYLGHEPRGI